MEKIEKTEQQWREKLTPEQYAILRQWGRPKRPFTGEYGDNKEPGAYHCAVCGTELFDRRPVRHPLGLAELGRRPAGGAGSSNTSDRRHGMVRTEVRCANCDAHLGHVFPDGPAPERQPLLHQQGRARARRELASAATPANFGMISLP